MTSDHCYCHYHDDDYYTTAATTTTAAAATSAVSEGPSVLGPSFGSGTLKLLAPLCSSAHGFEGQFFAEINLL